MLPKKFINVGEIYVAIKPTEIITVLGSCVAVCLYDTRLNISSMNHYLVPLWNGNGLESPKYGNISVERLIEHMLEVGSKTHDLVAKLFGGASINIKDTESLMIGKKNTIIAEEILSKYRIKIVARDTGGNRGRRIMMQSDTEGAKTTLEALEVGAVDFVTKPHSNIYDGVEEIKKELLEKVRMASKVKVSYKKPYTPQTKPNKSNALHETTKKVIAIGASTGGTEAIKEVLINLPPSIPGIVIVQHMPPNFTKAFAERLNNICAIEVKEAENGEFIETGKALIANGAYHMVVRRSGARYYVELGGGEKVSGYKPSVDVLFNSVAKNVGVNALGVILTGMGSDGAKGMLNMKNAGARTIAQDKKSCVVFGMPKVAIELGGVEKIISLNRISEEIIKTVASM